MIEAVEVAEGLRMLRNEVTKDVLPTEVGTSAKKKLDERAVAPTTSLPLVTPRKVKYMGRSTTIPEQLAASGTVTTAESN